MDLPRSRMDRKQSCSESDSNRLNSTLHSHIFYIPASHGLISEVDLNRFNSYPNIAWVPETNITSNDDAYVKSPMGQGIGTRLSARKADADKQERTLKSIAGVVTDIDNSCSSPRITCKD